MGLDGVELIIATEEKFGIEIADEEAQSVRTVGDLRRLVEGKLKLNDEKTCLTQRAFHRLRSVFLKEVDIARKDFRPKALLEDLVPRQNRIQLWSDLGVSVGAVAWPELCRPKWLVASLAAVVLAAYGIGGWLLSSQSHGLRWGVLVFVAATAFAGSCPALTLKAKTEFGGRNLRWLAEFLAVQNPPVLGMNEDNWTPERIRLSLRKLIVEQLGVRESQVKDEASFVHDLGVD